MQHTLQISNVLISFKTGKLPKLITPLYRRLLAQMINAFVQHTAGAESPKLTLEQISHVDDHLSRHLGSTLP